MIALDVALTSTGRIPALDLAASGTVRPELLVGEDGAEARSPQARAETSLALGTGCEEASASSRRGAPPAWGVPGLSALIGHPAPGGLGRELDRLAPAIGLHVGEAAGLLDEGDVRARPR